MSYKSVFSTIRTEIFRLLILISEISLNSFRYKRLFLIVYAKDLALFIGPDFGKNTNLLFTKRFFLRRHPY
jgi:hypothetical protein